MRYRTVSPSVAFVLCAMFAACSSNTITNPSPSGGTAVGGLPIVLMLSAGGISGDMSLSAALAAPPGDTVTVNTTVSAPPSDPVLQSALVKRSASQATVNTPLMYAQVQFSQATSYANLPAFSFAVSGAVDPTKGALYLALLDPTKTPLAYELAVEGPGVVTGSNVVFAAAQAPIVFAAGQSYVFALYQVRSGAPTPTPSPTAPPAGVLSVNPSNVAIDGTGSANAQTVLVQEVGYTGGFNESDTCAPSSGTIATIGSNGASGPSATFTATGVAAGTCTATFSDASGQHTSAAISVTTNGFTIQRK